MAYCYKYFLTICSLDTYSPDSTFAKHVNSHQECVRCICITILGLNNFIQLVVTPTENPPEIKSNQALVFLYPRNLINNVKVY